MGEKLKRWLLINGIALIIPILLLGYVIYWNYLPFGYEKTYVLDVGNPDDNNSKQDIYIESWQGSPQIRYGADQYRELNGEAKIIFKPKVDNAKAYVNIDFTGNNTIYIKDNDTWEIYWNPVWDNYTQLYSFNITQEDIEYLHNPSNLNVGDTVEVLANPAYKEIKPKTKGKASTDDSKLSLNNEIINPNTETFIYINNPLDLTLWKEDYNLIEGKDEFDILIYTDKEKLVYNSTYKDDDNGSIEVHGNDPAQAQTFYSADFTPGLYTLIIKNKGQIDGNIRIGKKPTSGLTQWLTQNQNQTMYFHNLGFKNYENNNLQYNSGSTIINTTLLGTHKFYAYLNDSMNLTIWKKDLNGYEGRDDINITLSTFNGTPIFNEILLDDDDGNISRLDANGKSILKQNDPIQIKNFNAGGIKKRVYQLDVVYIKGNNKKVDGYLNQLKINTGKIVSFDKANSIIIANPPLPLAKYFNPLKYTLSENPKHLFIKDKKYKIQNSIFILKSQKAKFSSIIVTMAK